MVLTPAKPSGVREIFLELSVKIIFINILIVMRPEILCQVCAVINCVEMLSTANLIFHFLQCSASSASSVAYTHPEKK